MSRSLTEQLEAKINQRAGSEARIITHTIFEKLEQDLREVTKGSMLTLNNMAIPGVGGSSDRKIPDVLAQVRDVITAMILEAKARKMMEKLVSQTMDTINIEPDNEVEKKVRQEAEEANYQKEKYW